MKCNESTNVSCDNVLLGRKKHVEKYHPNFSLSKFKTGYLL